MNTAPSPQPGWEITLAVRLDETYRADAARLSAAEPWFGEVAIRSNGRPIVTRVGKIDDRTHSIVDWRHPYGKAYYQLEPGDAFDMQDFADDDAGFADIRGIIERRAQVTGRDGALERVVLQGEHGIRFDLGKQNGSFAPHVAPRRSDSVSGLPDVTALLTPDQYRLITQSRRRPLIIQGRAGSGKTSVALFRVAWLAYPHAEPGEPPIDKSKVLIVMFNRALSAFAQHSLAPLQLEGVHLNTFHGWAFARIRDAYGGSIKIDPANAVEGREAASRIKKHIGVIAAIDTFIVQQTENMLDYLARSLAPYDREDWLKRAKASTEPPATMLRRLRSEALAARDEAKGRKATRLEQVHKVFDATLRRFTLYKEELLRLLTDTELLARHCPGIDHADLEALAAFQREVQLTGDRKKAGANVTFDDFALLLRLIQIKNGGYPEKDGLEPLVFDHLVIDEAQDFGAVELKVLLASVRSRTGVTIVGDLNQKIVPDASFLGWDRVAEELGVEGAEVAKLEVSHRSTAGIIAAADAVAGTRTLGGFEGARPELTVTDHPEATVDAVHAWLAGVLAEHPSAHACVVCRWPRQVRSIVDALAQRWSGTPVDVREGHNDKFVFAPGITVTNANQIKGLEFDAVVVLNPNEKAYPDTLDGQRLLYTVMTRARERLLFAGEPPLSPLVQRLADEGLLDDDEPPVAVFETDDDAPFEGSPTAAVAPFVETEDDDPF